MPEPAGGFIGFRPLPNTHDSSRFGREHVGAGRARARATTTSEAARADGRKQDCVTTSRPVVRHAAGCGGYGSRAAHCGAGAPRRPGKARRELQPQWEGPAASPKPRSNSELVRVAPSSPQPEFQLLSRGAMVETDVRGNLGPASTLTNAANADWLKDRWQVRAVTRAQNRHDVL